MRRLGNGPSRGFTSPTGNKNYAAGVETALGIDALTQAEQMFLDQTDPDGHPLTVAPVILLVPNALYVPATQIRNSTEVRDPAATKKTPVANPHAGKFRPVRSSYLSNAQYTGNSSNHMTRCRAQWRLVRTQREGQIGGQCIGWCRLHQRAGILGRY